LELHQGRRQAVVQRRKIGVVRGTARAAAGVGLVAVAAFMFLEIDVLTAILSAAATQYGFVVAAVGAQVGAMVLGPSTIAYLQSGAIEALLIYLTLAVGLIGGYAAIRTAAHIAKAKAA
jgi:hypothetical protein